MGKERRGYTRREILRYLEVGSLWIGSRPFSSLEEIFSSEQKERLSYLIPNPSLAPTNYILVPESFRRGVDFKQVGYAVNFSPMYDPFSYDHLNRDVCKRGDLWGNGKIIKEEARKGKDIFLVVETPGRNHSYVTLENWRRFVTAVALEYPASYFVIGNEINVDPEKYWQKHPDIFAHFFSTAANAIKGVNSENQVLMYGEAYWGNGEVLRSVLSETCRLPGGKYLIDGLAFHYYDTYEKLKGRTDLYWNIIQRFGLKPGLFLTELGKPEMAYLDTLGHRNLVVKNLSAALSLVQEERISSVLWHTAYSLDDFRGHNLFAEDTFGEIYPKSAFNVFETVSKLLYKDIQLTREEGKTVVTARASDGIKTKIVWKDVPQNIFDFLNYPQMDFLN